MKNFVAFLREHIFIMFAGWAALVHSVWTLDVMFSGPEIILSVDPINAIWRKVVAFMIAFAIDIGQIVTSSEIKKGHRSKTKYFTFFSFAAATYFLQWVYMIHHTPHLAISEGIRQEWVGFVNLLGDASIWIVPVLLPASTLLYTFSQKKPDVEIWAENRKGEIERMYNAKLIELDQMRKSAEEEISAMYNAKVKEIEEADKKTQLPEPEPIKKITSGESPFYTLGDQIQVRCPDCTDFVREYDDIGKATSGLRSHKPYCKHNKPAPVVIENPSTQE